MLTLFIPPCLHKGMDIDRSPTSSSFVCVSICWILLSICYLADAIVCTHSGRPPPLLQHYWLKQLHSRRDEAAVYN